MTYTTLRLCSHRAAFEAVPVPRRRLDLGAIRRRIDADGVAVVDARVLLIVGPSQEVTIGRDGRILIKLTDPTAAGRWFDRALRWIEPPPGRSMGPPQNP